MLPLAAVLFVAAPDSFAQQLDRRSRDEPEIVVNAGGRIGFCDALRFDAGGEYLIAAGDDKVATVWPVAADGKTPPRLKTGRGEMQVLRWPSWREKRGGIKQVAVSPDGTRVAVGGHGLITSGVAVIDRTKSTGDETAIEAYTWPKDGKDHGTVTAVAFDAEGKRVAFGTADGSLWVWTPEKGVAADKSTPTLVGKHAEAKGEQTKHEFPTRSRLVFFAAADKLVSVSMSGEVLECDLTAKTAKQLGHLNPKGVDTGRVYRAERTPDGKGLAVAFMGPTARVCSLDNKDGTDLALGKDRVPWAVAVGPDGRVAVAVGGAKEGKEGEPRFYLERANEVWVYDAGKQEPAVKLPNSGRADAVAFHPKTKGVLAVAGGEADEVSLFDLDGKTPKVATSVCRGAGRKVFAVGIGQGSTVAVKVRPNPDATHPNDLGAGDWIGYSLANQGAAQVGKGLAVAVSEADDWRVVPDADKRGVWYAVRTQNGREERAALWFDEARYNDPTCYTFLPKGKGGAATRLLVGHYHGCSLYELPNGKAPDTLKPTRVYVGHSTEVLSVAAAADGSWFVTGGADQTVAAFNLTDWPGNPTLGATFAADGDEVRVTAVAVGSPAWEAGLKKGDRVLRLGVGGKLWVYNPPADAPPHTLPAKPGTPADAVAALKAPAPGVELYFEVAVPKGTEGKRLTTVQQRPVWKWFPAFADGRITDSVVWMWKGSWYAAKSPRADELIGWHMNGPAILDSPRYYPLKRFEDLYKQDDLLNLLLDTRDVPAALAMGSEVLGEKNKENPALPKLAGKEPPRVEVALNRTIAGGKPVTATVQVVGRGTDVDLVPERVELWLNDHRYRTWKDLPNKPFEQPVDIPAADLRSGDNTLTVLTYRGGGGRGDSGPRVVSNPTAASSPNLFGLAVGVNDYADHRKVNAGGARGVLGDLNFAATDAKDVFDRFGLEAGKGKWFTDNLIALKTDGEAKRQPLLDALDALADPKNPKGVKPDDVLVLFLAGHGQRLGDVEVNGQVQTELVPDKAAAGKYKNVRFAFCCPDFDLNKPAAGSLTAEALFDRLAAINCHKMVFLDVCHSGGAVESDVLRRLLPHDQAPFVFAACGFGQKSYENPELKHGLFTQSLLEAMGPNFGDADIGEGTARDGKLTCEELVNYCTKRVETLRLRERRKTDPTAQYSDQMPYAYPAPPKVVVATLPPSR